MTLENLQLYSDCRDFSLTSVLILLGDGSSLSPQRDLQGNIRKHTLGLHASDVFKHKNKDSHPDINNTAGVFKTGTTLMF